MQIAGRQFRPPLGAVLLTVAAVLAFGSLGLWQLDRADQKRALLTAYQRGADRTIPLTRENVEQLVRYQQVELHGRYDSERQVLLDNMPSTGRQTGRPGYHVWTLLRLDQGGAVLVNRGWVPMIGSRERLPDVSVDGSPRTVVGRLDFLPAPGVRLAPSEPRGRWPEVLYYPTAEQLSQLFGESIPARIVLLDPAAADGYERIWQMRERFSPNQHIAYAVQWFAFAATAVVVFLVVNLKKPKQT
jgi:surfeit locus 1 family protein